MGEEKSIELHGKLLGIRRAVSNGICVAEIVRICTEQRPNGPAENALVLVETLKSGIRRARYISWIGYYDIEEAQLSEPGTWELIEPSQTYRWLVEWMPFGWVEMQKLPNHRKI
jgi:hypothetical protein